LRAFAGKCGIAIMAKAPIPGAVKTRLVPPLTAEQAAELAACFLRDTAATVARVALRSRAEGVVVYTPRSEAEAINRLVPAPFERMPQRGKELTARLTNATRELFGMGFVSVIFMNADTPHLPARFLRAAMAELARAGDRVVLGPAEDGGYYLIGLKQPHTALFERIRWSTPSAREQTLERAAGLGLATTLLPAWYDVDDATTLRRLRRDLCGPRSARRSRETASGRATHTRAFLKRLAMRD
jgi:uncharacterized protein